MKPSKKSAVDDDWISALAAKAASDNGRLSSSQKSLKREERIERRTIKKRRREERKGVTTEGYESHSKKRRNLIKEGNNLTCQKQQDIVKKSLRNLHLLSEHILNTIQKVDSSCYSDQHYDGKRSITGNKQYTNTKKLYVDTTSQIKGKAVKNQQLTIPNIQPRTRDYGGLGLARPSLLILLRDQSFVPKFEQEFSEHIPGFFGKQRTKAMKKQLDKDMLWRKLQTVKEHSISDKKKNGIGLNTKYNGKLITDMTPDERVEAMIKLGVI